jgi:hypothetical protein
VRAVADGDRVIVSHEMPEPVLERLRASGLEVAFGCGGAISVAPLVPGVRAGLRLATGPRGVSVRGRLGLVIARAAGARVESAPGVPFPEDVSAPARALAVAAEPSDLAVLHEALAAAP